MSEKSQPWETHPEENYEDHWRWNDDIMTQRDWKPSGNQQQVKPVSLIKQSQEFLINPNRKIKHESLKS